MQEGAGDQSTKPGKAGTAGDHLEEKDSSTIPQAVPVMAMFVPLEESLFDPFDPPRNAIDRIKLSQEKLEKHTAAVEQNILFIYEREHQRISQVAKQEEAQKGFIETPAGLMQGEEALIMESVHAPVPPGVDYSDRHLSTYKAPDLPQVLPPRQAALQWSLYNAGQAVGQLTGYAGHAEEIKEPYRKMLERQAAQEALPASTSQDDEPARS
ncbi:hypothetical protein CORC01_05527 [Colletotrichum orchidophilum]|uniref:Uncharacterized protein n=1 Tax=Colletotrichum orchidophilum TaxID=1209926 RepID=A0A1G4BD20_9PEZI|nr:uncharacterized protein CORC01_05527 [Colletotrichum orchidophilum]OHE99246.1 hypothetical protein CORC01_05527 [Colletotrichum orchidophilum]